MRVAFRNKIAGGENVQQLTIFDFLEEVVENESRYTFDLITKRDHRCKCGGILIPRWNKEQGHYDSVCAHCFSTKERFYPANMCQRCGCTTNVYQVWLYDYNAENVCKYCIRQDMLFSKFFKPSIKGSNLK
jgi:hypothetical protein